MQSTPSRWKRTNPLVFMMFLAVLAAVVAYLVSPTVDAICGAGISVMLLSTLLMYGTKILLELLGRNGPGKKFVAEVVILHWSGETSRFWGCYRHEWLAGFAAQYMAYILDHLGFVHWEFGIQFRVHDKVARQAHLDKVAAATAVNAEEEIQLA